jgi:hypothetical protein
MVETMNFFDDQYRARATPTLKVHEYLSHDPRDMQLLQDMHFDSVMRYGSHPALSP